ncbi:glycosyltransferase [Microbacterium deminutum]
MRISEGMVMVDEGLMASAVCPIRRASPFMADQLGRHGARFLLAMIDGGGTVPPAIGLATELVRRGHAVHLLADPTIEASARSAGCGFSPWRDAPHFDSRAEQTAMIAAMEGRNPLRAFRAVKDFAGKEMTRRYAEDVVATVREFPVDAVLADGLPGILIGAQSTGLPTAALLAQTYLRPTPGLPLMGTGWSPGPGVLRRARDSVAPKTASWLLDLTLPRLNVVVAGYGQPPLRDVFELFDRCMKVLVMTSPSFDFVAPRLPANVRYVGPQLDDPGWAAVEWHSRGPDPLVLVATSSIFQHQVDLLQRIARAVGQLPVRGLITTGTAVNPDEIAAPPNVEVVQAAPHSRILPEASAVITHAGHGTLIKALAAGVPLVCIPMGRDQKDNTVRALRHGAGVRLSAKSTPDKIAAAVADILDNPHYTAAARRFAHILAQEAATTPSAADEAEAMLRS